MKKNVLILLFAVCFAFALFPCGVEAGWTATTVYVGNTEVSPAVDGVTHYWQAAESGDSAYAETGSAGNYLFSTFYDRNTGEVTLTLNGIDITTYSTHAFDIDPSNLYNAGIYSDKSLNLVLQGKNTIKNSDINYGIMICWNSLYISGAGSLSVSDCIEYGLLVDGDDGGIRIDGSTVEVTGGASGIRSLGSNSSIDIDSSTVTVTGQSRDGIIVFGDLMIEESMVNVDVNGIGIVITGGLTVADGASLVTAGDTGYAIICNHLDFPSHYPYKYKFNTAASDPGGDYTFGNFVNSSDYKYVEIVNCPDVYVSGNDTDGTEVKVSSVADGGGISYWLNDGNGSITATGAGSSNYNVKYEEKTHTLTLKDAVITKYYGGNGLCGIYAGRDLHVVLEGDNQLGTAPTGENFDTLDYGIYCGGSLTVSAASGATLDVYAENKGLAAHGSIQIRDGSIAISAVCEGVYTKGHDVTVTGEDTILDITAGTTVSGDAAYGILAGSVTIAGAAVNIEKKGSTGDAIRSDDEEGGNICIYGDADVKIVDWSTEDEFSKCGLHSDEGNVAIGDTAKVDIVSQFTGIYAEDNLYIGYEPSGAGFAAVGDPTVKINDADSIAAVTPAVDNDFVMGYYGLIADGSLYFVGGTTEVQVHRDEFVGDGGCFGICAAEDGTIHVLGGTVSSVATGDSGAGIVAMEGNIDISSGAVEAVGSHCALYCDKGVLTLPTTSYKYKSNTEASDPGGAYISGTYAYSAADKYVNIASVLDITKETASHGSYAVKTGDEEVSAAAIGETVALTAVPDSGYVFSAWTVSKTGDPSVTVDVTDDTFTMPAYPVTVAATYAPAVGVPYYVSGDKDIFIGFAANDKYIVPNGVSVLYKENKKTFTDVSGHWAADDIDFVTEREIFVGTGNGKFSPEGKMTRAMLVTVLGRLYERSYGEIAAVTSGAYSDCDYTSWYGKYVDWATKNNIIYGYGNAKFGPNDVITREEMATMIYRFADFLDFLPSTLDTALSYADANAISGWAQDGALYCQTKGLIVGYRNGRFLPQNAATRAEVATVVERFVSSVVQ